MHLSAKHLYIRPGITVTDHYVTVTYFLNLIARVVVFSSYVDNNCPIGHRNFKFHTKMHLCVIHMCMNYYVTEK